ncbi:MAG: ABC transporter ATP-binding protein [Proteobacteria bacterium]|nr:ABC transporter ATP-binding protein [Pseudomonadota bacterium]
MKQLELKNIATSYSKKTIIEDISFSLERGSICCLLGPSGCGKTTLLRTIAGFESPSNGQVFIAGEEVSRPGKVKAPEQRRIGMVFQDFALFPHLNVVANIAFGLKSMSRQQRELLVQNLLKIVGLSGLDKVYPHQLSGGQQQRVALARALAPEPEILLLDEPFSNMDSELKQQLTREILAILKLVNITTIFVTHNQSEAYALADKIGVMNAGRLQQWGSPYNLYYQPANHFVASFIGEGVFIPGKVIDKNSVATSLGTLTSIAAHNFKMNDRVEVLIRPTEIIIDISSNLKAKIVEKVFHGGFFRYRLQLTDGSRLLCITPSRYDYAVNDKVGIRFENKNLAIFNR